MATALTTTNNTASLSVLDVAGNFNVITGDESVVVARGEERLEDVHDGGEHIGKNAVVYDSSPHRFADSRHGVFFTRGREHQRNRHARFEQIREVKK